MENIYFFAWPTYSDLTHRSLVRRLNHVSRIDEKPSQNHGNWLLFRFALFGMEVRKMAIFGNSQLKFSHAMELQNCAYFLPTITEWLRSIFLMRSKQLADLILLFWRTQQFQFPSNQIETPSRPPESVGFDFMITTQVILNYWMNGHRLNIASLKFV